jgi:hypothetical protein
MRTYADERKEIIEFVTKWVADNLGAPDSEAYIYHSEEYPGDKIIVRWSKDTVAKIKADGDGTVSPKNIKGWEECGEDLIALLKRDMDIVYDMVRVDECSVTLLRKF